MEISDVRVRLVEDSNERLKAVCSITLNGEFVVRDVKIVDGTHGLFVAMPSRKLTVPCAKCRTQNHVRARCCNECGSHLPPARIPLDENGREKAHRDVAHPITGDFRQTLQDRVLAAYEAEAGGLAVEEVEDEAVAEVKVTAKASRGDKGRGKVEHDDHHDDDVDDDDADDHENDDDDDDDVEVDDDDDVMDDEDQSASEYDSLIAGLKGGRGSGARPVAPAGRGGRPDPTRPRGGQQGASRPAPPIVPPPARRDETDRGEKTDGGQRGGRRGGRGGRGRGGRDEQRPAATREGGGSPAVARDQPSLKPPAAPPRIVRDEVPEDGDAFGAGTAPKRVVAPPPSSRDERSGAGGRGRERGEPKPRTETRSRDAEKPPVAPARSTAPTPRPEPTPPPRVVEPVDDDGDAAFGFGIV